MRTRAASVRKRLKARARQLRELPARWQIRWPIWRDSIQARLRGKRTVHMLHIGKTGGTALKFVLRRNKETGTYVVRPHPHKVRLADIPPWDDFFFFVRDPVDRYVSGFNSRLREGRPRYSRPWTPRERWAFERFGTAEELALALSSDDPARRKDARRAMRSIRHVRSGFDTWAGPDRLLLRRRRHLLMVGRLETIEADFARLKALLGLPDGVALPDKDKAAHRDPGSAPRTLNDEARANIVTWYAADYRRLELYRSLDRGWSALAQESAVHGR